MIRFPASALPLAIGSGADAKAVQTMLGHKSATLTLDLYSHLFGDRLDVVADAMELTRAAAVSRDAGLVRISCGMPETRNAERPSRTRV